MIRMGAWYDNRSETERGVMRAMLAIVGFVLMFMLWLQAERSRESLARELPQLRASIATLERDAEEVKRLRAMPAATPGATTPLASLATNAGGVPGAQVTVIDERRVRLMGGDVAFNALLDWLGNARTTHGMRVESARIERLPAAGRVRAELVLARS